MVLVKSFSFSSILYVIVLCINSFGQWQWAVQAGGTPGFLGNYGTAICSASNGDLIFTGKIGRRNSFGMTDSIGTGPSEIVLGSYNKNGSRNWLKVIDTTDLFGYGKCISIDSNGTIYVLESNGIRRFTSSGDSLPLIKIDSMDVSAISVGKDKLFAAGVSMGLENGKSVCTMTIIKMEPEGKIVSKYIIDHKNCDYVINDLCILPDKKMVVAGTFTGNPGDTFFVESGNYVSKGKDDAFIMCVDTTGALVWTCYLGGPGDDEITSLKSSPEGGLYASGYFQNEAQIGSQTIRSSGGKDVVLLKFTDSGTPDFVKTFGSSLTDDYCGDMAIDNTGNIWLTGRTGDSTIIDNCLIRSAGSTDAFAVSFSSTGKPLTAVMFGGATLDEGCGIACADKNIAITGYFSGNVNDGAVALTSEPTRFDLFIASIEHSNIKPLIPVKVRYYAYNNTASMKSVNNAEYYNLLGRHVASKSYFNKMAENNLAGQVLLRKGNRCVDKLMILK